MSTELLVSLGSFVFCTALVAVLTYWLTRGDKHDTKDGYFLGGRSLTGGYIAGSLMLTNLSTEQLVGLNGAAFGDGLCVMAWEVLAGVSLVLMALFFLPRYLKSGIATVPEFLEKRFDGGTRAITSLIFIIAYACILLPLILYTGARGLIDILDLPAQFGVSEMTALRTMVWMVGLIGSVYAVVGGLRTVAVSDTINGFGLLTGGLLIAWFGLTAINGDGPIAAFSDMREAAPEKFNSIGGPEESVPFSTLFTGVILLNMFYWCTNQQIIQRTFGASTLKEGQKGVLGAGLLKLLAPMILVLPGLIAYHLSQNGELAGVTGDDAYGKLVQMVLPKWLSGFFAAVVVGAVLSSFNSALNSTATLFSLGVYGTMLRPNASEKEVIRSGYWFGWAVAIAAMFAAPVLAGQDSIFGYLQKMNGLYFIPIFSVVVMGLLNRRVPSIAANVALILGFAAIAIGYFVPQAAELLSGIHEFHFLGIVFASLVGLMLVASVVAPRPEPWVQQDAGAVDLTPWKFAVPVGAVLVLAALGMYIAFADFSVLG